MILVSLWMLIVSKNFATAFLNVKLTNPPLVYPARQYIVVDSHVNLTLGCRGTEPIKWTFNSDTNNTNHNSVVKESISNETEQGYKYELILTVFNVTYSEVGFYYCHSKLVNFDNPTRSNKIYVFVNDEEQLTVLSESQYFYSDIQNSEISLPCRPTSPDVNITLQRLDFYTIKKVIIEGSNYHKIHSFKQRYFSGKFDPFAGFLLTDLRRNVRIIYSCIFTKHNTTKTVKYSFIRGFSIDNGSYLRQEPFPYIDAPEFIVKYLGDNLTLQCSIILDMATYESLSWTKTIHLRILKLSAKETKIMKLNNFKLLISTITVNNITFKDEGFYGCDKVKAPFYQKAKVYVTVFDRNQNYSIPKISPDKDVQINANDNLTLTCEGTRPIKWRHFRTGRSYDTYNVTKNEQNITIYKTFLYLTNARYIDARYYYCYDIETEEDAFNPYKSSRIYVFVKDESNLFMRRTSEDIPFTQYSVITIPCLPTSLDVSVEIKQYSATKGEVTPVIYNYDPRVGYVVNMTYNVELYTYCYFKYKNKRVFLDISHSYYENAHLDLKLMIESPDQDISFVGSNLELYCRVAIPNYISADDLKWILPNDFSLTKMSQNNTHVLVKDGKVLLSHLIIRNVEKSDEGWYECVLNYNNEKKITTKKYVTVYDRFDINPVIKDLKYNQSFIGQKLILQCLVNVDHNIDFDISWAAPNISEFKKKNILLTTSTKYTPSILNIQGESKLIIENVTLNNQGNYTCNVKDSTYREKKFVKSVYVRSGRRAKIIANKLNTSFINTETDNNITLKCAVDGDPLPIITWKKNKTIIQNVGGHFDLSPNRTELKIYFVQPNDQGLYSCAAENPLGFDIAIFNLFVAPIKTNRTTYIIVIIIVLIMIIIMSVINGIKIRKDMKLRKMLAEAGIINFETGEIQNINPNLTIAEQATLLPYDKKWEIPRKKIILGQTLGSGNFGLVVKATISDESEKTVAVKTLKSTSNYIDLNALISELKIMIHIGKHVNIINLLGACTESIAERKLLVVVEYCENGSLRDYLLNNRTNFVDLIVAESEKYEEQSKGMNSLEILFIVETSGSDFVFETLSLLTSL